MQLEMMSLAFVGAILGDVLGLASALKIGDAPASKWRHASTYLGLCIYGAIAAFLEWLLSDHVNGRVMALTLGLNLPLVLEKLARLTPEIAPAQPLPGAGFAGTPTVKATPLVESLRRFVAKTDGRL